MSTNQELRQISIRAVTSTTGTVMEDWIALFVVYSMPTGAFDERMARYLQAELGSSAVNLPELQQEFAEGQGFSNWSSMGTFTPIAG